MKTTIKHLLLAAGFVLAGATHAETLVLEPISKPLDPALTRLSLDSKSTFEVRALSMADAQTLLSSTEGPAWSVLAVQSPACDNPNSREKVERKKCKALKADCDKADSFAQEHAKHAACSALYIQTTVLLTNDGSSNKGVKAAKVTPPKKVSKPVRKQKPKAAAPVVRKPAARSCDK